MVISWDNYFLMPLISDYGDKLIVYGSPYVYGSPIDKAWKFEVKRRYSKWRKKERSKKPK